MIATAYETLRDEESRADYDYLLAHPDQYYRHYYNYYRHRVAPRVDVRLVIGITILVISCLQYYSWWSSYNAAVAHLVTVPKYRHMATEIATREGMLASGARGLRGRARRDEQDALLREIIRTRIDIRGGYRRPRIADVLLIKIVLLPWHIACFAAWHIHWIYRFGVRREEYGRDEKLYLVRKNLGLSAEHFESINEEQKEEFLRQELWLKKKFQVYHNEQLEAMRTRQAQSSRWKRYRRWLRSDGPGRITFED
uniref:DnaJ (Hsp40) homolog, subfamily C, member 25 n=1 Tax=Eptatretus burgeri TaxID=7764 RepID=A0A8C4Q4M4_EPTBU